MRVHKYGLRKPIEGADIVSEQMSKTQKYYNELIAIERERRDAERAMDDGEARAALEAASEKRREADTAVKSWRAQNRKRSGGPAELTQALREAKQDEKACRVTLNASRSELRAGVDYKKQISDFNDAANEKVKVARKASGLYCGTYQLVESAIDQACKLKTTPLWDGAEPKNPRFKRWTGTGSVGVQIVWGNAKPGEQMPAPPCTTETIFDGTSRYVKITTREDTRGPSRRRENKRRVLLHLRVQSDDKRQPVWAVFPMVLHRPLPPEAAIKRVVVHLVKCGPRPKWSVDFYIQAKKIEAPSCGNGVLAVDFGWRLMERELRVAVWQDSDGQGGERYLRSNPNASEHKEDMLESLRRCEHLRADRDKIQNKMTKELLPWLRSRELPEWLRARTVKRDDVVPSSKQACAYITAWRAAAKFAALARLWKDNRFDGDDDGYGVLAGWSYKDRHLWEWETSQREKSVNHRNEQYRIWANQMSKRHHVLVLSAVDYSKTAEKPKTEDKGENPHARSNRQLAAVSVLKGSLINAFLRRGGAVVVPVSAEYLTPRKQQIFERQGIAAFPVEGLGDKTRDCNECGNTVQFDVERHVWATCSCGASWDQDDNAAKNLMQAYQSCKGSMGERIASVQPSKLDYGGPRETRFQKLAREKKEREEVEAKDAAE